MTASTKKMEDYIKSEIKRSGFPLEETSAMVLNKLGWNVRPHIIFYDEDKNAYKELDIQAEKLTKGFDERAGTRDILIIQCKKQAKKPWVFFEQDEPNKNVFSVNVIPTTHYGWFEQYFKTHYYYNKKPCAYHFPSFVKQGKPDVILEAINQVINALRFFTDQEMSYVDHYQPVHAKRVTFFYPVIVFNGRLFSARVQPSGEIELAETEYLQLRVTRALKEPISMKWSKEESRILFLADFIIDIVRNDYLEEFLRRFS